MSDFFTFKRMLTPIIISFVQGLALAGCLLSGFKALLSGEFGIALGLLFVGPVAVRLFLEGVSVVFSINETLTDIKKQLERQAYSDSRR